MIHLLADAHEVPAHLPPGFLAWRVTEEALLDPEGTPVHEGPLSVPTLLQALHLRGPEHLILLRPFGIRLLPFVRELDQESVDIRSASDLVRTERGWRAHNRLWRKLLAVLPLKGKHVTILGSGHAGRTALYAARRGGARSVVLITRRDALSIHKVLDVFTLSWHPVLPVQQRLKETEVLIHALPAPAPFSLMPYLSPRATVVVTRLIRLEEEALRTHPGYLDGWTLLQAKEMP